MGNTCAFLSISLSMKKCRKANPIGKAEKLVSMLSKSIGCLSITILITILLTSYGSFCSILIIRLTQFPATWWHLLKKSLMESIWTVSLHHMEGHDFPHKLLVAWVNSANSHYHMGRILFWRSEPFLLPSMKLPFHGTPLKGNFYTFSQNICPRPQYNSHRMNLKVFCTNNIPLYRTKQLLKTSLQCYVS